MADRIKIYISAVKYIIIFYLSGCKIYPAKILRIQQSFYHQIKGLFDKKIFPYLYKIEKGETVYGNSLVGSLIELNSKYENNFDSIFKSLPPSYKLIRLFLLSNRLKRYAISRNFDKIKSALPVFQELTDTIFVAQSRAYSFDLAVLLKDVIREVDKDYKEVKQNNNIQIKRKVSISGEDLYIPFNESSTWQNIIRNFIINAIEACENKPSKNIVEIGYRSNSKDNRQAVLTIVDNGCGMDSNALSNFYKRGFSQGKPTGTGLGIIEEHIEFLNQRGGFQVESSPGAGTTIQIDIDPEKINIDSKSAYQYKKRNRAIRVAALVILVVVLFFSLDGMKLFKESSQPQEDNFIAGFSLGPVLSKERPYEYKSINLRTEANNEYEYKFSPMALKMTPGDSLGPIFLDFDSDSSNEIITVAVPPIDKRIKHAGTICCISANGVLEWQFEIKCSSNITEFMPFAKDREAYISQLLINDFNNDSNYDILVVATFPNEVSLVNILDYQGRLVQQYIHYGRVRVFEIASTSRNNETEPVLVGENILLNDRPILTRLSYIPGKYQSPPYPLPGISPASEMYYLIDQFGDVGISELDKNKYRHQTNIYNSYFYGAPDRNLIFLVNDGRKIISSSDLESVKVEFDENSFNDWWNELISDNSINREFNNKDMRALNKIYLWNINKIDLVNQALVSYNDD